MTAKMAVARIKVLRNQREVVVRQMRRDIALPLHSRQDATAIMMEEPCTIVNAKILPMKPSIDVSMESEKLVPSGEKSDVMHFEDYNFVDDTSGSTKKMSLLLKLLLIYTVMLTAMGAIIDGGPTVLEPVTCAIFACNTLRLCEAVFRRKHSCI
ncbi:hypothetical protein SESBI_47559 [Sesbania bispinosa]|nr:hypothetical protein SESBI_47559 [Sesbania bispinosa]